MNTNIRHVVKMSMNEDASVTVHFNQKIYDEVSGCWQHVSKACENHAVFDFAIAKRVEDFMATGELPKK